MLFSSITKNNEHIQHVNKVETEDLKAFLKKITNLEGDLAHIQNKKTCEAIWILSSLMDKETAETAYNKLSSLHPNLLDSKLYKSTSQEGQYRIAFKADELKTMMKQEKKIHAYKPY